MLQSEPLFLDRALDHASPRVEAVPEVVFSGDNRVTLM